MPLPPPVTIAVFPDRSNSSWARILRCYTDPRPGSPDRAAELRARYRAFMEEHVYPNEDALSREDDAADELLAELRARAKAEGLWAPHLPPEAGGTGRGFLAYANLNEEIGRVSGRSTSSTARRRTRATARSSTCSAPTSRRSAGSRRSSPATPARSSR